MPFAVVCVVGVLDVCAGDVCGGGWGDGAEEQCAGDLAGNATMGAGGDCGYSCGGSIGNGEEAGGFGRMMLADGEEVILAGGSRVTVEAVVGVLRRELGLGGKDDCV